MKTKLPKILVVDDEPNVGMIFRRVLEDEGYEVLSASNGAECLRALPRSTPDLVFLDIRMPGMSGLEVLQKIRETQPTLAVVMMTAYQTVSSAVECMKLGAFDYLIKPLDTENLKLIVKQALAVNERVSQKPSVRSTPEAGALTPEDLVAESPEMRQVMGMADKVAPTDLTVLILGESGTGKEVAARAIHRKSNRRDKPFVVVDCASLPESLIESELFGHEKGAFTGADSSRAGKFESADGGTIFLDEIGNLPLATQAKLLRFLQEPQIERLGSRKGPITLNVRILAATNADLEKAVKTGSFREDLFHRLKVFLIQLPPLSRRGATDIDKLSIHIVEEFRRQLGKPELTLSAEALKMLQSYRWPGNIRELQNALRSASLLADDRILPVHLPMSIQSSVKASSEEERTDATGLNDVVRKVEKEHISAMLDRCHWDLAQAAELLGLDREMLEFKIAKLNIIRPS